MVDTIHMTQSFSDSYNHLHYNKYTIKPTGDGGIKHYIIFSRCAYFWRSKSPRLYVAYYVIPSLPKIVIFGMIGWAWEKKFVLLAIHHATCGNC